MSDAFYGAQQVSGIRDGHLDEQFRVAAMDFGTKEAYRVRSSEREDPGVGVVLNRFEAVNAMSPVVIEHPVPIERRSIRQRQPNHRRGPMMAPQGAKRRRGPMKPSLDGIVKTTQGAKAGGIRNLRHR